MKLAALTDDQLMLEVIDKGSCSKAHPVPLLFVHGGWHSASCWGNFLDFFADAGYRAVAMSLRGHGASPCGKRFHACSIADFVDDVRVTADDLGGRPILVAHSLGGFVVQRYLETHEAPAAVLLASVPPQGVLGLAMRVWSRHPWISMRSLPVGNLAGFIGTAPLVREHLFCATTRTTSSNPAPRSCNPSPCAPHSSTRCFAASEPNG